MPVILPSQRIERKVNFAGDWKVFRKNAAHAAGFCWLRSSFAMECCKRRSARRCDYCAGSSKNALRVLRT
jgi:hypothetical protein